MGFFRPTRGCGRADEPNRIATYGFETDLISLLMRISYCTRRTGRAAVPAKERSRSRGWSSDRYVGHPAKPIGQRKSGLDYRGIELGARAAG